MSRRDQSQSKRTTASPNKGQLVAEQAAVEKAAQTLVNADEALVGQLLEKNPELANRFSVVMSQFAGPIPPPEMLRQYHELDPSYVTRILDAADEERRHRHSMDEKVLAMAGAKVVRGQICALIAAVCGLAASVALGYFDQTIPSAVVGGSTLIGVVVAFIGRPSAKKSSAESNEK